MRTRAIIKMPSSGGRAPGAPPRPPRVARRKQPRRRRTPPSKTKIKNEPGGSEERQRTRRKVARERESGQWYIRRQCRRRRDRSCRRQPTDRPFIISETRTGAHVPAARARCSARRDCAFPHCNCVSCFVEEKTKIYPVFCESSLAVFF